MSRDKLLITLGGLVALAGALLLAAHGDVIVDASAVLMTRGNATPERIDHRMFWMMVGGALMAIGITFTCLKLVSIARRHRIEGVARGSVLAAAAAVALSAALLVLGVESFQREFRELAMSSRPSREEMQAILDAGVNSMRLAFAALCVAPLCLIVCGLRRHRAVERKDEGLSPLDAVAWLAIVGNLGFAAGLALCWHSGVKLQALLDVEEPVRGSLRSAQLSDQLINILYGSLGAAACLLLVAIALALIAWKGNPFVMQRRGGRK